MGQSLWKELKCWLILKVPKFGGSSYIRYPGLGEAALIWLEIELVFRPTSKEGLLLYNGNRNDGQGDFMAIFLNQGFVEFAFDLGNGITIARSEIWNIYKSWTSSREDLQEFQAGEHGWLAQPHCVKNWTRSVLINWQPERDKRRLFRSLHTAFSWPKPLARLRPRLQHPLSLSPYYSSIWGLHSEGYFCHHDPLLYCWLIFQGYHKWSSHRTFIISDLRSKRWKLWSRLSEFTVWIRPLQAEIRNIRLWVSDWMGRQRLSQSCRRFNSYSFILWGKLSSFQWSRHSSEVREKSTFWISKSLIPSQPDWKLKLDQPESSGHFVARTVALGRGTRCGTIRWLYNDRDQ